MLAGVSIRLSIEIMIDQLRSGMGEESPLKPSCDIDKATTTSVTTASLISALLSEFKQISVTVHKHDIDIQSAPAGRYSGKQLS